MVSQCFDLQKKGKHVQCFDELFTNIVYLENLFNKKVKKTKQTTLVFCCLNLNRSRMIIFQLDIYKHFILFVIR